MEINLPHRINPNVKFRLLDLPVEIVLEFCGNFVPREPPYLTFDDYEEAKDGFEHLARLARTCKALALIVREVLSEYKGREKFMGLIPYACNMLRNSELANRETKLRIVTSYMNGSPEDDGIGLLHQAAQAIVGRSHWLRERINDLSVDYELSRHNKYLTRNRYLARAHLGYLLLKNLPNIESLTIDTMICYEPELPRRFLDLPSLRHAKFIGIRRPWHEDPWNEMIGDTRLDGFTEYLDAAKHLEALELERIDKCPTRFTLYCRLRSLTLRDCRMNKADLNALLRGGGQFLDSFIYVTGFYGNYLRWSESAVVVNEIFPSGLADALQTPSLMKYLKILKIDLRERGGPSRKREVPSGFILDLPMLWEQTCADQFIDTLQYFDALRDITLTQQCLWEPYCYFGGRDGAASRGRWRLFDLLPKSVESFTLGDVSFEFFPAILQLAMSARNSWKLENLKRVRLYPRPDLIREFAHAKAHADDRSLPTLMADRPACNFNSMLEPTRIMILWLFQRAGVDAEFPMEVYPIMSDDKEELQRQRLMGHWCHKCHFYHNCFA